MRTIHSSSSSRRRRCTFIRLASTLVVAACFVLATAQSPTPEPTELVIGAAADPTSLHPIRISDGPSRRVMRQMFDALVDIDFQGNVVPLLAHSWDISDDGLVYTFYLNKGVTFHDGTGLTAADVLFTLESILDPSVESTEAPRFALISELRTIDDYTLEITLSEPSAPFIVALDDARVMPRHIVQEVGHNAFGRQPVGSGPFRFVEWIPDQQVVLEAYPAYFGGEPSLDRLVFRTIPEGSVRMIELEAGSIDITLDIPPHHLATLEADPDIRIERSVGGNYHLWAFNNAIEPFDDIRVRKALAMAIDKQAIVDLVLSGVAEPAKGPIPPGSWAYNEDLVGYSQDIERARELLAEAGYPDGFSTTILIDQDETRRQIAQIMQAMLQEVGVTARIEILEWGTFTEQLFGGNYETLIVWRSRGFEPDELIYTQFHSSGLGGRNFGAFADPRVDELLEEARRVTDQNERAEIYNEVEGIIVESATMEYLYHELSLAAMQNYVTGFTPHARDVLMHIYTPWGVDVAVDR